MSRSTVAPGDQETLAQLCEAAKLTQTGRLVRDATQLDDTLLGDVIDRKSVV